MCLLVFTHILTKFTVQEAKKKKKDSNKFTYKHVT
jgi:hypothetical protein